MFSTTRKMYHHNGIWKIIANGVQNGKNVLFAHNMSTFENNILENCPIGMVNDIIEATDVDVTVKNIKKQLDCSKVFIFESMEKSKFTKVKYVDLPNKINDYCDTESIASTEELESNEQKDIVEDFESDDDIIIHRYPNELKKLYHIEQILFKRFRGSVLVNIKQSGIRTSLQGKKHFCMVCVSSGVEFNIMFWNSKNKISIPTGMAIIMDVQGDQLGNGQQGIKYVKMDEKTTILHTFDTKWKKQLSEHSNIVSLTNIESCVRRYYPDQNVQIFKEWSRFNLHLQNNKQNCKFVNKNVDIIADTLELKVLMPCKMCGMYAPLDSKCINCESVFTTVTDWFITGNVMIKISNQNDEKKLLLNSGTCLNILKTINFNDEHIHEFVQPRKKRRINQQNDLISKNWIINANKCVTLNGFLELINVDIPERIQQIEELLQIHLNHLRRQNITVHIDGSFKERYNKQIISLKLHNIQLN